MRKEVMATAETAAVLARAPTAVIQGLACWMAQIRGGPVGPGGPAGE